MIDDIKGLSKLVKDSYSIKNEVKILTEKVTASNLDALADKFLNLENKSQEMLYIMVLLMNWNTMLRF